MKVFFSECSSSLPLEEMATKLPLEDEIREVLRAVFWNLAACLRMRKCDESRGREEGYVERARIVSC